MCEITSNNTVPLQAFMDLDILGKIELFLKSKSSSQNHSSQLKSTFRIWWFIVFMICLSVCGVMIFKIYEKYDNTPVIVTFATRETPLYKIPFPAITICPEVKSVKRLLNFTDLMLKQDELNLTDTE
jgi:quinol-cytochrome oxidoreductase complex cytochrome b subunit